MKLMRFIGTASAACAMTATMAGTAMASDVMVDTTGPGSSQVVSMESSSTLSSSHMTVVRTGTTNIQSSDSGNSAANSNTGVNGSINSGDVANDSTTATVVSIDSPGDVVVAHDEPAGGQGTDSGSVMPTGSLAGSVLGAATAGRGGSEAMLPSVGATLTMDVSALRAAWQPQTSAPTAGLVLPTRGVTAIMLITATLLSLVGALGSVMHARRKTGEL